MDKKIIKEYENWFNKFKKERKKCWSINCDIEFKRSIDDIRSFIKKKEKEIYDKIDKEISKNKQDRAILTKAKRFAKNNEIDSKYIDLRFEELWEEEVENTIHPYMGKFVNSIMNEQSVYERRNKPKPIGGDGLFD